MYFPPDLLTRYGIRRSGGVSAYASDGRQVQVGPLPYLGDDDDELGPRLRLSLHASLPGCTGIFFL